MDAFADALRCQEGNGTCEGVEPGSFAWALQKIEAVKAGLRDDPGRAYSVEFKVRLANSCVCWRFRNDYSAPAFTMTCRRAHRIGEVQSGESVSGGTL